MADQKSKKEWRKAMRNRRDTLSSEEIQLFSSRIFENLCKVSPFCVGNTLFTFLSIRSEVLTNPCITYYRRQQKITAAPRVEGETMAFYSFEGEETLSADNPFHIPEPVGQTLCVPDEHSVVLVPGLLFDKRGNRLGYGGGFYDRYFAAYPAPVKIAVAYDFQLVEKMEAALIEATDKKVDFVVTNSRILSCHDGKIYVPA